MNTPISKETVFTLWLRRIASVIFLGLFLFELANLLGILTFNVEYTWRGRVFSTAFVFCEAALLDWILQKYAHIRLHGMVWFAVIVLILVDFFGDVSNLYARWSWYDQVAHFLGGPILVGTFVCVYEDLAPILKWNHPRYVTTGMAYGTSLLFAVLYEMQEYIEDIIFHSNRLGDGVDTANDLLMNLIGGLVTIAGIWFYRTSIQPSRNKKIPTRSS